MPHASNGDVKLYFEDTGSGYPILFIHEFAGDHRSWEPQVRYFSRRYRCITYSARGYPPSDVPQSGDVYGQQFAVDDAVAVLNHLGIARAHIVGLSMGGFCTTHFGMQHAGRARSLTIAGCGYGSPADDQTAFRKNCHAVADRIEAEGWPTVARDYAASAPRLTFERKDPRGYAEFLDQFIGHDGTGAMMHMRYVQGGRPSLFDFADTLASLPMPVMVVNGDEDPQCFATGMMLKQTIPDCGHWILPDTGHTINLEEPDLFNQGLERFFAEAETRSPA